MVLSVLKKTSQQNSYQPRWYHLKISQFFYFYQSKKTSYLINLFYPSRNSTIYHSRLEIRTIERVIGRWWDLTIKFVRTIRIQIFFARFMIARFRLWRWVDRYFRILKSIELNRRYIILFSAATNISQASSKALLMLKGLLLR